MPKSTSVYRRLTRRKRSPLGFSELWLGPGHILLVKSNHYTEEYQRFALADIHALVITGTSRRMTFQWMALAASALWTLGLLAVNSIFAKGFFGVTGAFTLAIVVSDIARGPRCRCHIYTAVSRELLTPVSRLRKARMFLAQITPLIEAVQGARAMVPPTGREGAAYHSDAPASGLERPRVPTRPFYLAEILFVLLLANAALVLVAFGFPKAIPYDVLGGAFFAQIVFALGALTLGGREHRRVIDMLAIIAILATAWDFVSLGRGYFDWVSQMTQTRGRGNPILLEFFWEPSRQEAFFAAGWRLAAGLAGLTAALVERRRSRAT